MCAGVRALHHVGARQPSYRKFALITTTVFVQLLIGSSGPCIRGHRSSKCDHRDRVLVEVRKPGRPLSSCPHPSGSCSCERVVINYTIPKSSECACPSERAQSVSATAGSSRVQKNRRKSTAINAASVEKAMKAVQDADTDTSSYTRTSTEISGSDEASPQSSASSTPRILPARNDSLSSCCQPKPVEQPPARQGGCCSSKSKQIPEPVLVKSCCSSSRAPTNAAPNAHNFGQQFQFQLQSQAHVPQYANMQPHIPTPASFPFSLGHPIYNHSAAAYQQANAMPMSPANNGPMSPHMAGPPSGQRAPEHNCHCGENCSCFGCAAHPNNATMMEYVRLMAQFQYTGGFGSLPPPLYDMPTYPHHPGYGAEAHQPQPMGYNPMNQGFPAPTPTPTQMSFHAGLSMPSIPPTQQPVSSVWHQPSVSAPSAPPSQMYEPSSYITATPSIELPLSLKTEELTATPPADSPNDGTDGETPTLSPTSYFWNQMVLPNCSDATGTCQCGDGCECVGCLTHGGHNGVALAAPALNDPLTSFPDFSDEAGLHIDDPTNFLFNPRPTV